MTADAEGEAAAAYCADQVRRFDHDRWLTALFAPEPDRRRLLALYAFNVEVARIAEQVSQPMLGEIRLQWWREALDEAFAGRRRRQPVVLELAAMTAYLDRGEFERILDARAQDLYLAPPGDLAALEAYADDTAGALAALALAALGIGDQASRAAARDVGIAWALAGLIRAVPFHAARGKVFLPEDLLQAAGLTAEDVVRQPGGAAVAPVIRRLADTAADRLAAARQRHPDRAALPVLLPAALADLYLHRIRRSAFDPRGRRLAVSGPRRQLRLLQRALRRRY